MSFPCLVAELQSARYRNLWDVVRGKTSPCQVTDRNAMNDRHCRVTVYEWILQLTHRKAFLCHAFSADDLPTSPQLGMVFATIL